MKDFPRVTYNESEINNAEELDNIFEKLVKNVPEKLMELRKQQILDHSESYFIVKTFNELANLIGKKADSHAEVIAEQCQEQLIQLHSPVYLNVPVNAEPYHKWESWTAFELYTHYFDLVMEKGWEDWYFLTDTQFNEIKNYHILDMLNDLVVNDYIICGYELRSFMNCDDDNRLLEPFNHDHMCDKIIDVKLKEKFASMKEYNIWKKYGD